MPKPDPVEAAFWAMIEAAWKPRGAKVNAQRVALAKREPGEDEDDELDTEAVDAALDDVIEALRAAYQQLSRDDLAAMDRVLERKLYDLDRQDIQAVTDGSDDGFLYARGYIVALGKDFYDAVLDNPEVAIIDAECEEMCYLPAHVHKDRFGAFPTGDKAISRETGSNKAGWE